MKTKINYILSPAILNPLLPFLTSISYGNILCTCKEIHDNFDYKSEWQKRCPYTSVYLKKCCMIKEGLYHHGACSLLQEVTNKKSLKILLYSFRLLQVPNLTSIYEQYLSAGHCSWNRRIRLELSILYRKQYVKNSRHFLLGQKRKRYLHHILGV